MALLKVLTDFENELDSYGAHLRGFAAAKTIRSAADFGFSDECFLEGVLSRVWQCWGAFCRTCVIESCRGSTNASGGSIAGLPGASSEAHVSGAAILAKRKATGPWWSSPNTILRLEPTWGDVDVLVKIVTRLSPTNSGSLLAGFSTSHPSAKAFQVIRNASAHNDAQSMIEVMTLRSSFIVFPIVHPIHALFWTEPRSKDFLVMNALDELKTAAATAIV